MTQSLRYASGSEQLSTYYHGAITAQRFMYTEQHDYSVTAYRYGAMYVEQH